MNTPAVRHLAIIGGGFGGTMILAHFIASVPANAAIQITVFEDKHPLGTGVAYGTADDIHLLNVRAGFMSAFVGKPLHFFEWLHTDAGKHVLAERFFGHAITEETYVPRTVFGEYIKHIAAETIALAQQKNIALDIKNASVTDIMLTQDSPARLQLTYISAQGTETLTVDAATLATGHLPPRTLSFAKDLPLDNPYYVHDIWHAENFSAAHIASLPPKSTIVIIGTGLTAVDAILSLTQMHFQGKIVAISRNGWLPAVHLHGKAYPAWQWTKAPESAPSTALSLLHGLRQEVAHAEAHGYNWRSVVDSLRPVTQMLWQQLPLPEKRRFIKRLLTVWGIHRHRMANSIHERLLKLQNSDRVRIVAARILSASAAHDGINITYTPKSQSASETLHATLLVNCTGPDYDARHFRNNVLNTLHTRGMITAHSTGIGISTTTQGTALGTAQHALFVFGTLQTGELLESVAVPELREQAYSTAQHMLTFCGCC